MFSDPAFFCYALECEGEIDTRQGKLNRAAKKLRVAPYPQDPRVMNMILNQCGLTNVTLDELAYIRREAGL